MMKVGDYIRTKNDGIKKITKIDDFYYENYEDDFGHFYREKVNKKMVHYIIKEGEGFFQGGSALEEDIIKSNSDIKKVIEEGDILKLLDVQYDKEYKAEVILDYNDNLCVIDFENNKIIDLKESLFEKNIKLLSIATHEQFSQMEYKVGE